MPRVLVQLNSLGLGGTQLSALDLAVATGEQGYDSVLVGPKDTLPSEGPSMVDVAEARGIPLILFDRAAPGVRGATTVKGALGLSRLADRCKADIVHAYSTALTRAAYWGPCILGRRPLVVTAYEMEMEPGFQKWPTLIVGTRYLFEEQASRPGRTELISPPVDLERDDPTKVSGAAFRKDYGMADDQCVLVIVSRLDEKMKSASIEAAIQAMGGLSDPKVVLFVVGGGTAASHLDRAAREVNHRLGRRAVIMVGPMADPRSAYAAADVVIGMGGSAARGLGFGKPLVVSGEMGRFRVFTPITSAALFRNSFWCNEPTNNSIAEFVSCLDALVADPHLRQQLGRFGRTFASENFSLRLMASRLVEVYESAATNFRSKAWLRDAPFEMAAPLRWYSSANASLRTANCRAVRAEPGFSNSPNWETRA